MRTIVALAIAMLALDQARAQSLDEVARCRSLDLARQWACFEALNKRTTTPPIDGFEVKFAISVAATNPPSITGQTNLPDGTKIAVWMKGDMPACYSRSV